MDSEESSEAEPKQGNRIHAVSVHRICCLFDDFTIVASSGLPRGCVNRLGNGRTPVSTEMAFRLGATFRTSPDFWLNAQKAVDLFRALQRGPELPQPLVEVS